MSVDPLDPTGSIEDLEEAISRPSDRLVEFMRGLEGDVLVLGVGGKMGPTLARMAVRASEAAGTKSRVMGVSSFSTKGLRERLGRWGVETIQANLLDAGAVEALPDAANVIYMIGRKFGSSGDEWNTWATNVLISARVAARYASSRIVVFSSGNVYPFEPVTGKGSVEETPPGPVGEYAMSCLGRERMFDYVSHENGTRVLHYRLNYAAELRYGVILDIATKVWRDEPVDVSMGHVNCVWQGYANAVALQCLGLAQSPPRILNVTGPEVARIRDIAARLGAIMDRKPKIAGTESDRALLNDASRCHGKFGAPEVTLETLVEWVARWVMSGGDTLDKPTHFETRNGAF